MQLGLKVKTNKFRGQSAYYDTGLILTQGTDFNLKIYIMSNLVLNYKGQPYKTSKLIAEKFGKDTEKF